MLSEKGYYRPLYDELLEQQIERAKQTFGEDIDTTEQSIFGKFIRLCVNDYADIYEDLEKIYYARFPGSASGVNLDRICPFAGLSRTPAISAQHKIKIIGIPASVIEAGFLVQSDSNAIFQTIEDVEIKEDGTIETVVECQEAGVQGNVTNITTIVNPSEYVDAIEYIELTKRGEEIESDYALRQRFKKTVEGTGSGTANSIIGAIQRVNGVTSVNIVENDTEQVDSQGRPPHSFEVYVLATKDKDYEIAEAIFNKKPVAIRSAGQIEVEVKDAGGLSHIVRFSRSIEKTIYLKIKIKTNNLFDESGIEEIKTNLVNYCLSLENGQDVILSSLYGHIHKVNGVVETSDLSLSSDGKNYDNNSILCNSYEVARLSIEHIEIEVEDYE